jgi:hypothetical protein
MTEDDPHTVRYPIGEHPAWQVVYWNGNTESGRKGADRASLEIYTRIGHCRVRDFALPEELSEVGQWISALARAHAAGKEARSRELRELLGVKIA